MSNLNFECYIFCGDKCNFHCSHCVSNSGKNANRFSLTLDDINFLANTINTNFSIKIIHFIGGEPTLFLNEIEILQKKIIRDDIEYAMTTNGWFVEQHDSIFKKISLNKIIISFDKFHQKFIKLESILKLSQICVDYGYQTSIHVVYETLQDLIMLKNIPKGVELQYSLIYQVGRYAQLKNKSLLKKDISNSTCPSLKTRVNNYEKVTYIPKHGFTPCCSKLIFEYSNNTWIYSKKFNFYNNNKLCSLLRSTFSQQLSRFNIKLDIGSFNDECSICDFFYGQVDQDIPSLSELVRIKEKNHLIKYSRKLSSQKISLITHQFTFSYIMYGRLKINDNYIGNILYKNQLKDVALHKNNIHKVIDDILPIFIKDSHFNEKEQAELRQGLIDYCNLDFRGRVIKKHGKIVGVIGINFFEINPYFHESSMHIGFIGYKKDNLSRRQRIAIRQFFKYFLKKNNSIQYQNISSKIFYYNESSIRFHESLGLTPKLISIGRRDV